MAKTQKAMSQGGWETRVPSCALCVRLCYLALTKIPFLLRSVGTMSPAGPNSSHAHPQGAMGLSVAEPRGSK